MTLHCLVCASPIPAERARRKAVTCSKEHAAELHRIRLEAWKEDRCALCGRRSRRRVTEQKSTAPEAVGATEAAKVDVTNVNDERRRYLDVETGEVTEGEALTATESGQ